MVTKASYSVVSYPSKSIMIFGVIQKKEKGKKGETISVTHRGGPLG
jgi:hypothetical protein